MVHIYSDSLAIQLLSRSCCQSCRCRLGASTGTRDVVPPKVQLAASTSQEAILQAFPGFTGAASSSLSKACASALFGSSASARPSAASLWARWRPSASQAEAPDLCSVSDAKIFEPKTSEPQRDDFARKAIAVAHCRWSQLVDSLCVRQHHQSWPDAFRRQCLLEDLPRRVWVSVEALPCVGDIIRTDSDTSTIDKWKLLIPAGSIGPVLDVDEEDDCLVCFPGLPEIEDKARWLDGSAIRSHFAYRISKVAPQ